MLPPSAFNDPKHDYTAFDKRHRINGYERSGPSLGIVAVGLSALALLAKAVLTLKGSESPPRKPRTK